MDFTLSDIRQALRALVKRPTFAVLAVVTLALGIGANTAIFSVIHSLILRPLPGAERPRELVSVSLSDGGAFPSRLSYPSYLDYLELEDAFVDAVVFTDIKAQLSRAGQQPERIVLELVTGNYFDLLGVEAIHGRTFTAEEAQQMGAGNVVVLDHEFWQARWGGDTTVIGEIVRLNGQSFTVVGVTPEEFRGTAGFFRPPVYAPITGIDYLIPLGSENLQERYRNGGWMMVARLQPGVGLEDARAIVATHAKRLEAEYPETQEGQRAVVHPEPRTRLEPSAVGYMPLVATVFMILVSLVLAIACANVANLLLARTSGRRQEIALRAALGASRLRIVRQLLTESVVLGLLGGGLGLLVALWVTRAISSFNPASDIPLDLEFVLDRQVFLYAFAIAVLTGLLSGLVPALHVCRADLASTLKEGGGRGGGSRRQIFRNTLVVAQVAVSLVLLVSAGLFVQTARNATQLDMGFEIENRLVVGMDVEIGQYDEERGRAFYRQLLDRVRALPGVDAASTGRFLPIGFSNAASNVHIEGVVTETGDPVPFAFRNSVSTGYFETMGMPILHGRSFTEDDREENTPVVIVNDTFAQRFWPEESPLGRRFSIEGPEGPFLEVVGTTRTVKFTLPAESPTPGFYLPFNQHYRSDQVLHVYTAGDPLQLVSTVRTEIAALDPEMPIWDVRSMETHIKDGKMMLFDLSAALVGGFGAVGLVLAAIGLYGLMAYSVAQRTKEMGIRIAMGATGGKILGLVLRYGLGLTGIGIVVGLLLTLLTTASFANLLVGVGPRDPLTLGAVALFLAVVATVAALVPARRASSVDPILALRDE